METPQPQGTSGVLVSAGFWAITAANMYGYVSGIITIIVGLLTIVYFVLQITKDPRVKKFFHKKGDKDELDL